MSPDMVKSILMSAIAASRSGILSLTMTILPGMAIFVAGCDAGISEKQIKAIVKSINDCNGKRLANLYSMYQERFAFKGPPDAKAFKKFITGISPAQLEAMGVTAGNIDALFVSERDGQPFDIRYGASWMPGAGGHQAVIFESQGSAGRVAVYMTGVKVLEIDPAEVAAFKKGERDERPTMADGPSVSAKRSPGPS